MVIGARKNQDKATRPLKGNMIPHEPCHKDQSVLEKCFNCGTQAKSRRRNFSDQAWTVLLLWNEIHQATIDQPICEECYTELRDILIDRNEEIEKTIQQKRDRETIKEPLKNINLAS